MSITGFELSLYARELSRHIAESAREDGLSNEVAVVEVYLRRAYGASGPRSHRPDLARSSDTDQSFGNGWYITVVHHNDTMAATLGRHVMFSADYYLDQDWDMELHATAAAVCAFAGGRIGKGSGP